MRWMRPILLIEDDANDAMLVRETLAQLNLVNDVVTAPSVEAAKSYVKRENAGADHLRHLSFCPRDRHRFSELAARSGPAARQCARHHDERID